MEGEEIINFGINKKNKLFNNILTKRENNFNKKIKTNNNTNMYSKIFYNKNFYEKENILIYQRIKVSIILNQIYQEIKIQK